MSRIVHIGPGAFHRAHQAVYTEEAGGGWQITAVSLRSAATVQALSAQGGRYTLVTRSSAGTRYRTVNAITAALAAQNGPAPIQVALTHPDTRVVSLTITEKGYSAPPGPGSAITCLVTALKARMRAGLPGLTLLSCDNLTNNGAVLHAALKAEAQSAELADWMAAHVCCPATMVDRITPASTAQLRAEVAEATGWADQIPVEAEDFSQWVIEDSFAQGRPAWEAAGADLVQNVAPYEDMKLRMLNGAHSMLAYAGHLSGQTYVRDVMAQPLLAAAVARHMTAAAATLDPKAGLAPEPYQAALLERFRNPHIAHETYQIAMDGSQKMPQRIFAPAAHAARTGQDLQPFAFAAAVWLKYLEGRTEAGQTYALRDPRAAELAHLPKAPGDRIKALCALPDLVPPDLASHAPFLEATAQQLKDITDHGILASLAKAMP